MDELTDLRTHIEQGRYADALLLIGEMEEMSRDDKIQKIESFLQVLLVHLIKQQAEGARPAPGMSRSATPPMRFAASTSADAPAGITWTTPS
jgi:hypothetical protein